MVIVKLHHVKNYEFNIHVCNMKNPHDAHNSDVYQKMRVEKKMWKNINDVVALVKYEILSDDIRTASVWIKFKFDSSGARLF